MTAQEARKRISLDELLDWAAFYEVKYEAEKKAMDAAKTKQGKAK